MADAGAAKATNIAINTILVVLGMKIPLLEFDHRGVGRPVLLPVGVNSCIFHAGFEFLPKINNLCHPAHRMACVAAADCKNTRQ
jgi:hypothetical protein